MIRNNIDIPETAAAVAVATTSSTPSQDNNIFLQQQQNQMFNSLGTDGYCPQFLQFNYNPFEQQQQPKNLELLTQDILSIDTNKFDFGLNVSESLQQTPNYYQPTQVTTESTTASIDIVNKKTKKLGRKRKKEQETTDDTTTTTKKKSTSTKPSNQRRNIKKILTDDKLNEETLRALNEEKERIERLTKSTDLIAQQQHQFVFKQELDPTDIDSSLNQTNSSIDKSDQSIYVIEEEQQQKCSNFNKLTEQKNAYFANYNANFYNNLIANNQLNGSLHKPPPPPPHPIKEIDLESENYNTDDDIIECNDSNREEDDDCLIISESEHQQEEQAVKKSLQRGIHMNDEQNVPNANGQVLVNVNHSQEDCDVFLLPYLAKNVKSHQIGGIRFMYDNIVESLSRIKNKQTGFGCILAHAMGLGKTLQVISFIEVFLRCTQSKRVLCIVPINTIQNWQSEFNNWLPENGQQKLDNDTIINYRRPFKVYLINDYARTIKQRTEVILDWTNNGGVLLIGYEMFRTLISNNKPPKQAQPKKNKNNNNDLVDIDDEEELLNKQNTIKESLLTPCLVVCDEGHRIKNNAANIAKTLQTIKTKRRVVLTGYPLQNNLIEYWCMVDFVRPSYLGTKAEFSNMFERPIMNGQCMDSTREDVKLMRFRAHVLHSLLEGFVQRRGHDVFLNTLPKKHEYIILLKMSQIQKELYLAFMEAIGAMSSNEKTNPLRSFAICCKIWNHPDVLYKYYVDKEAEIDLDLPELQQQTTPKKSAAKTISSISTYQSPLYQEEGFNPFGAALNDTRNNKNTYDPDWAARLMETYKSNCLEQGAKFLLTFSLIEESIKCGDKILLFSQSLLSLDLIEKYLQQINVVNTNEKWKKNKHYFRLDGSTPGVERERLVNSFNKPNNDLWLFLLSTRAGCLGINLIGANRVIVLDASWNPCHDAQAVCRVYRYGQKKNCFIYRLIADHTMEKKIYDRQISKQSMSDRVIDEIQGENHFTRTEVEKLIHFVKEDVPAANLSDMPLKFADQVLINSCMKHSHVITKEPFTHESLLIDKKEYQLSEREKALAFREYQHDKKYFPYTRNSSTSAVNLYYQRIQANHNNQYSNMLSSNVISSLSNSSTSSSNSCSSNTSTNKFNNNNNLYSNILNDNSKDLDFNLDRNYQTQNRFNSSISNDNNSPTIMKYLNASEHLNSHLNQVLEPQPVQQQQGPNLKDVKISRFTATNQLKIPTSNSSDQNETDSIIIQPGQTVFLLQTPKGCYLRTADKKYIALRGQTFEDLFTNGLDKLNTNNNNNSQQVFIPQMNDNGQFKVAPNESSEIQQQQQSFNNINNQQNYYNQYQIEQSNTTNYDFLANSINTFNTNSLDSITNLNLTNTNSPDFTLVNNNNNNNDFLLNASTNSNQFSSLNVDSF